MNNSWNEERIAFLNDHWASGLSASQIAAEFSNQFGAYFTRSAILGKAHRLGLTGRKKIDTSVRKGTKSAISPERSSAPPGRLRNPTRLIAKAKGFDPGLPAVCNSPEDIPLAQRKTLQELTTRTCRWPIGHPGEANFFFCGAESDNRFSPYCNFHRYVSQFGYPAAIKKVA